RSSLRVRAGPVVFAAVAAFPFAGAILALLDAVAVLQLAQHARGAADDGVAGLQRFADRLPGVVGDADLHLDLAGAAVLDLPRVVGGLPVLVELGDDRLDRHRRQLRAVAQRDLGAHAHARAQV